MSNPRYKWTVGRSETFDKCIQDAKDKHNTSYFKKLGQIIDDLATSDNPNRMGEKKALKFGVLLAIDVTPSIRLTYSVDRSTRTIILQRVGDHMEAQGKK